MHWKTEVNNLKRTCPMAKKEKFHSEAPESVINLLHQVIDKFHKDFDNTEFKVLFKHGGWKSKGKTLLGKMKILGDDLRSTWGVDVILYLNADMWNRMSKPQMNYVLDDALYTLNLKYNRHGNELKAPDGRPLLTTVSPDIEVFFEVVKRHGSVMEDVKRLGLALSQGTQITLEDALEIENTGNDVQETAANQREGVTGTISTDGTVNLATSKSNLDSDMSETDNNQLDMDRVIADQQTAGSSNVVDITRPRAPRVTKAEKAEAERLAAEAAASGTAGKGEGTQDLEDKPSDPFSDDDDLPL
jgi:hypothetical protein